MRQINVVAVIVSWIVDIGGTNLVALLYVFWATATRRVDPQVLRDPATMMSDPDIVQTLTVVGFIVSVIAGYVAARIAARAQVLHGALSSVGGLALGLFSIQETLRTQPLWLLIVSFVGAPIAGALGGLVEFRLARRRAESGV